MNHDKKSKFRSQPGTEADEAARLERALAAARNDADPLEQVRTMRQEQLAACALRTSDEIEKIRKSLAAGTPPRPTSAGD